MRNFRYALRVLLKNPGFALVAVITLALGIGANTAIFSVADALLLRPLPYAHPERLVLVYAERADAAGAIQPFSFPRAIFLTEKSRAFSGLAAFTNENFNLTGRGDPEQLSAARVSWNFFDLLGVRPMLGRAFLSAEDQPGGKTVCLISHALWTRTFAARADIVGQNITLDATPYTIIGVLARGFSFAPLGTGVDIWAPRVFDLNLTTPAQIHAGVGFLSAVARLAAGISAGQADAEMRILDRQYRREYPGMPDADPAQTIRARDLREQTVSNVRTAVLILCGAVGLLLLIACANVAALLLSRSLSRRKEIAIRAALGASRAVLIRQLLAESVLLALAGGALGIALSAWGTQRAGATGSRESAARGRDRHPLARSRIYRVPVGADRRAVRTTAGDAACAGRLEPCAAVRGTGIGRRAAAQPGAQHAGGGASGAVDGSAGGRGAADSAASCGCATWAPDSTRATF